MRTKVKTSGFWVLWLFTLSATALPAAAQGAADSMQRVRDKLRGDKQLLVAEGMVLTEAEGKAFWPIYENYQKDFGAVNDRLVNLIQDYAKNYASMTPESARKMVDGYLAIEADRQKIRRSYLPKFRQVLPEIKVARLYQLENKIQAAVNYELAAGIPLIE
jgi:hypothetical protein